MTPRSAAAKGEYRAIYSGMTTDDLKKVFDL